jgi:DNA-binding Lrp family transcriptional regulator
MQGAVKENRSMDAMDEQIIAELERDGRLTVTELAERVNLSIAPCHRRLRELERSGVIAGYRAVVDAAAVGLGLEVLANVTMDRGDAGTIVAFEEGLAAVPEVRHAERLFGIPDYLLRVVAAGLDDYARVRDEKLATLPGVRQITSTIVMKRIVDNRPLPLPRAAAGRRRPGALASLPPRRSAFGHRLEAFPEVLGFETADLCLDGYPDALFSAVVPRHVNGLPGAAHRERRLGGHARGQLRRGGFEVLAGDHPVSQPDLQGLGSVDDLTEQDHLSCPCLTHDPGQPDGGPHIRHQAEARLRQADLGAFGEDAEVARQGELQPGTVSVAAHGGDTGAAKLGDPAERPGHGHGFGAVPLRGGPFGPLGKQPGHSLGYVDAGREHGPFPGHHEASQGIVGQQFGAKPGQFPPHQRVLGVALAGTGQGQGGDAALAMTVNGLVLGHWPVLDEVDPYSTVWIIP